MKNHFPSVLAGLFLIILVLSGIHPVFQKVWFVEIIPVVIVYGFLIWSYRQFRFSNTAYALMFFWLVWHSIGAHYTFANVPFQWFSDLIGSDRNHFDRFSHFMIGFYAYPMAEWAVKRRHVQPRIAGIFGIFFIMSVAAGYEIIEWIYAVLDGGDAGIEFLGSQGDQWDAQKDMLCDTLGAITATILFYIVRPYKLLTSRSAASA